MRSLLDKYEKVLTLVATAGDLAEHEQHTAAALVLKRLSDAAVEFRTILEAEINPVPQPEETPVEQA